MPDRTEEAHSRFVPEGYTRDCIDPWVYAEFKYDGGVSLCCVRKPIGNINEQDIATLLRSAPAQDLRRALLAGELDDDCRNCGLRDIIKTEEFAEKIQELRHAVAVPADFDSDAYLQANPDVQAAAASPEQHFMQWGRLEGRRLKP